MSADRNAEIEYAALNRARDRRKKKRERNMKIVFAGGYKQIPLLNAGRPYIQK